MAANVLRIVSTLAPALLVCACVGPGFQERMGIEARRASSDAKFSSSSVEEKTNRETNIADDARRQLEEYYICNRSAAAVVATQTGDPVSLAIAARNFCRTEEHNLGKVLTAAQAHPKIYGRHAISANHPAFSRITLEKVRKQALENNMGDIVAFRATENPTLAPSRPPKAARPPKSNSI